MFTIREDPLGLRCTFILSFQISKNQEFQFKTSQLDYAFMESITLAIRKAIHMKTNSGGLSVMYTPDENSLIFYTSYEEPPSAFFETNVTKELLEEIE